MKLKLLLWISLCFITYNTFSQSGKVVLKADTIYTKVIIIDSFLVIRQHKINKATNDWGPNTASPNDFTTSSLLKWILHNDDFSDNPFLNSKIYLGPNLIGTGSAKSPWDINVKNIATQVTDQYIRPQVDRMVQDALNSGQVIRNLAKPTFNAVGSIIYDQKTNSFKGKTTKGWVEIAVPVNAKK